MKRSGISAAATGVVILILALGVVSVVFVDSTQGTSDSISNLQSQIRSIVSGGPTNLPVMNQAPTVRTIRETWYLSPSAHQDRFDPAFIVVNQGDTVRLTFIDNDTVAHDFVVGPPYSIVVNATVPGLINDLTGETFTTPATNNSPGVVVTGTPGNVTATYSFVATHSGIFEFVCTYHAQVGMIGYLVVLPNSAYEQTTTAQTSSAQAAQSVAVTIVQGAGTNSSNKGFTPNTIHVVLGVNNTVVWTNDDFSPHTVTSDSGLFDSSVLSQGQTFSYTFQAPGTYHYHCFIHPWMTATVVVTG
jgi:plastocyanin